MIAPSPRGGFHAQHHVRTLVRTYGDAEPGTVVALVGSQGCIGTAVVRGSAAVQLAVTVGTPVTIPPTAPRGGGLPG